MKPTTDELFTSDLWTRALEGYGRDTHLSVKLFDAAERVVFGPVHPTPLFALFEKTGYDPGIFAECARLCLAQTDTRPAVMVHEMYGLAVVGTSLALEGTIVGAAVGGYAFVDFSHLSEVQRLAKDSGIQFERLWQVAREQKPVPRQRLTLNGELLQVLGDALLREHYRARQYEEAALKLEEAIRAKDLAHHALQRAHDELESLVLQRTAALRRLSSHLQFLQDEEHRRLARELHDSIGQYLAAIKMNLALLDQPGRTNAKVEVLAESNQLVDRCIAEIRTISYLLHPPMLDESGLLSATTWYVEGFAKRSRIQTDLDISPVLDRLPRDVEMALFRALQEGLTNVHRHSGSPKVDIRIDVEDGQATLVLRDYGRGITPGQLESFEKGSDCGVGLAGMRERVRELGGSIQILSETPGTSVKVTIPAKKRDEAISPAEHLEERGGSAA